MYLVIYRRLWEFDSNLKKFSSKKEAEKFQKKKEKEGYFVELIDESKPVDFMELFF